MSIGPLERFRDKQVAGEEDFELGEQEAQGKSSEKG